MLTEYRVSPKHHLQVYITLLSMDVSMYCTIELKAKGVIFWQGEKRIPYGDLLLMKCIGCPRKKIEAAQVVICAIL